MFTDDPFYFTMIKYMKNSHIMTGDKNFAIKPSIESEAYMISGGEVHPR
jgi:hypothetical protein